MKIFKLLRRLALATALLGLCSQSTGFGQDNLDDTRTLVREWIEVRTQTAEEREQWKIEKEMLQQTRELLAEENATLKQQAQELEATATEDAVQREELTGQLESLRGNEAYLRQRVRDQEKRLLAEVEYFPWPLREKIGPLLARMPTTEEAAAKGSLGERMQNLVAILQSVDKFNTSVTLVEEERDLGDGRKVVVQALYWGLASAYAVSPQGDYAAVGFPAEGGWQWVRRNELAPKVNQLLAAYAKEGEVDFVPLPASVDPAAANNNN